MQQQMGSTQESPRVVSWKRFSLVDKARAGVAEYIDWLKATSLLLGGGRKYAEDQDYPTEVLSFHPLVSEDFPIILIGGMGPLAGAAGFDNACEYFGTRREILLYQACSVPSRMMAMVEPNRMIYGLPIQRYLIEEVSEAILQAKEYLHSKSANIQIVLMCNAVHYYLPLIKADLEKRYPQVASDLQYVSLVSAVIAEMDERKLKKPLLLGTSATKIGRVYTDPLEKQGIKYQELSEGEQELLMSIIYQGVKAFDQVYAVRKGEELFNLLRYKYSSTVETDVDCMITGCTEIPILLEWLQEKSQNRLLQDWLAQLKVINPVISALKWISNQN